MGIKHVVPEGKTMLVQPGAYRYGPGPCELPGKCQLPETYTDGTPVQSIGQAPVISGEEESVEVDTIEEIDSIQEDDLE